MKDIGTGWVEGSVQEFLGLSDAEAAYVEAKTASDTQDGKRTGTGAKIKKTPMKLGFSGARGGTRTPTRV